MAVQFGTGTTSHSLLLQQPSERGGHTNDDMYVRTYARMNVCVLCMKFCAPPYIFKEKNEMVCVYIVHTIQGTYRRREPHPALRIYVQYVLLNFVCNSCTYVC